MKQKILLHVCCAICGAALVDLLKEQFEIVVFFYNPNIHPEKEYVSRRDSVKSLANIYNLQFIEGEYNKEDWFSLVKGFETEPEGGARCPICFKMRLDKVGSFAKENNCQGFLTTLALSPYKSEEQINNIAKEVSENNNVKFITLKDLNIDKKEVWRKTRELAKQYNFYHQKYCGCIFSVR